MMDRFKEYISGPTLYNGEPEIPEPTTSLNYCNRIPTLVDYSAYNYSIESLKGKIDYVLVSKARNELFLIQGGNVLKTYRVAFGFNKVGHKFRDGDGRTPEGVYKIESKNNQSAYHLSLKVSYPNKFDRARTASVGMRPGGDIMIHGLPNDPDKRMLVERIHSMVDWTEGCMAVTDQEVEEIFSLVKTGTTIEICPAQ